MIYTKSLRDLFRDLELTIRRLDAKEADRLISTLETLVRQLTSERSHSALKKRIESLAQNVARAEGSQRFRTVDDKIAYLRSIRNQLTHGTSIDETDMAAASKVLWSLLKDSASNWDPKDLSRLLAYALRSPEPFFPVDLAGDPEDIVTFYQGKYNKIPVRSRSPVFKELLLRLYTEKSFQSFLQRLEAR